MWGMWANVGDVGWGGGCGRLALAMSRSGASRTRLALAMPRSGASRTRLALAMLLKVPRRPVYLPSITVKMDSRNLPAEWAPYWTTTLDS